MTATMAAGRIWSVVTCALPSMTDRRAGAGSTMSVSPSWPTTRTSSPGGISAPCSDRAVHSSPTAYTTPSGASDVLTTPSLPVGTRLVPPAP